VTVEGPGRETGRVERAWVPRTAWAICLLIGLLDAGAAITPRLTSRLHMLAELLPGSILNATPAALLAVGIGFILLAGGLGRRKRRAWQLACLLLAGSTLLHLLVRHSFILAISVGMLVLLLVYRDEFYAAGDPYTRWRALRYLLGLGAASLVIGTIIAYTFRGLASARAGFLGTVGDVALGMVGIETGLDRGAGVRADVVYYSLLTLGLITFGTALFLLLRSPRPLPLLTAADQAQMRGLLEREGERDSLGYFALRRDKSVVWSHTGKACVAYRVTSGVMLASGDPLGSPDAWAGAIDVFISEARRHAWVPAVVACSELGAEVWCREAGLDALEIGDEAVVEVEDFSLEGRSMRNVRQMVNRVRRTGYVCELRRQRDIPAEELEQLRVAAGAWRVGDIERGYSMALGRFGDPADSACMIVTAKQNGELKALLAFAPWGPDGLSLDLMRRSRDSDPGVNELLIVETLAAAPGLGIARVSLNFAVFRAALARGERIGAGPAIRAWRRLLLFASRWAQIESLYRFNAKFQPAWEPRFVLYPDVGALPRVAVAYLEAEAFLTYPKLAFWRRKEEPETAPVPSPAP